MNEDSHHCKISITEKYGDDSIHGCLKNIRTNDPNVSYDLNVRGIIFVESIESALKPG
jgi:hypothetical protein